MSHAMSPEELLLLDAGELDAAEAERVSAHVAGCADCAAQLREWRLLGRLVARGGAAEPSAARREAVVARAFAWRPGRALAWAGVLAAAAVLLLVLGRGGRPGPVVEPKKPADPWVVRHGEAMKRLGRPAMEVARNPAPESTTGGVDGVPDAEEETLARAREAVADWQKLVHAEVLFPQWVPAGMRFREARPPAADGCIELTFAGAGGSISLFVGAGSGAERSEATPGEDGRQRTLIAGTSAGLKVVLVGEGVGLEELKRFRASLERPVK